MLNKLAKCRSKYFLKMSPDSIKNGWTNAKINVRENRRAIKDGQTRDTGNIGYTRQKEEDRQDEDN